MRCTQPILLCRRCGGYFEEVNEAHLCAECVIDTAPITHRITILRAWFDAWVGFYFDQEKKILYFFPVPCLGLKIKKTR